MAKKMIQRSTKFTPTQDAFLSDLADENGTDYSTEARAAVDEKRRGMLHDQRSLGAIKLLAGRVDLLTEHVDKLTTTLQRLLSGKQAATTHQGQQS